MREEKTLGGERRNLTGQSNTHDIKAGEGGREGQERGTKRRDAVGDGLN